jgi:hypothetical protein
VKRIDKRTVSNCQRITESGRIRQNPALTGAALLNAIARFDELIANDAEHEQTDWT